MANPDDLSLLGGWISRDTLGNAGIALLTLIASAGGFMFAQWWGRKQTLNDLKRQKLEEFCTHMQDAVFHIAEALQKQPPDRVIAKPIAVMTYDGGMEHMEQAERAFSMAHTIERLYFPGLFGEPYHKTIQARRVIGSIDVTGVRGYDVERLRDLLGVMHGVNGMIWKEFKSFL